MKDGEHAAGAEALRVRWPGLVDFPSSDTNSESIIPALGTVTAATASGDRAWSPSRAKTCFPRNDPAMVTLRKRLPGPPRGKGPCDQEEHAIRQVMRRRQADLRFKVATEWRTCSRLKGAPPPPGPILERLDTDGDT